MPCSIPSPTNLDDAPAYPSHPSTAPEPLDASGRRSGDAVAERRWRHRADLVREEARAGRRSVCPLTLQEPLLGQRFGVRVQCGRSRLTGSVFGLGFGPGPGPSRAWRLC